MKSLRFAMFWTCLQCLAVSAFLPNVTLAEDRKVGENPAITILVYNYAPASSATMARAELETGRIFSQAGVGVVWLDCLGRKDDDAQGLCVRPREPFDVAVRILPGPMPGEIHGTRFGFAVFPALASVYYEDLLRLAKSGGVAIEFSTILGCAIAHEVGHLMLGENSHSTEGIMQAEWKPKQIRLALKGWLVFTSSQSKLIQTEASVRLRLQTGSLHEERIAAGDRSLRALQTVAPIIIGASQQQERFLTCVAQLSPSKLRDTDNPEGRLTIVILEPQKFLEMREAFHAHKTRFAFSSMEARRIYLSARMTEDFEVLLRCITHELGHFATRSRYEDQAEIAAGTIRKRAREVCAQPAMLDPPRTLSSAVKSGAKSSQAPGTE
jgi:hypothetical protein